LAERARGPPSAAKQIVVLAKATLAAESVGHALCKFADGEPRCQASSRRVWLPAGRDYALHGNLLLRVQLRIEHIGSSACCHRRHVAPGLRCAFDGYPLLAAQLAAKQLTYRATGKIGCIAPRVRRTVQDSLLIWT